MSKKIPLPTDTFKGTVKNNDEDYDVVISVYSDPIRQNASISCFTKVEINHKGDSWGHFYLEQPIPKEGAAGVFDAVKKNLMLYKTPEL